MMTNFVPGCSGSVAVIFFAVPPAIVMVSSFSVSTSSKPVIWRAKIKVSSSVSLVVGVMVRRKVFSSALISATSGSQFFGYCRENPYCLSVRVFQSSLVSELVFVLTLVLLFDWRNAAVVLVSFRDGTSAMVVSSFGVVVMLLLRFGVCGTAFLFCSSRRRPKYMPVALMPSNSIPPATIKRVCHVCLFFGDRGVVGFCAIFALGCSALFAAGAGVVRDFCLALGFAISLRFIGYGGDDIARFVAYIERAGSFGAFAFKGIGAADAFRTGFLLAGNGFTRKVKSFRAVTFRWW